MEPAVKKTRVRKLQACLPCHWKKRKCNRGKPCEQCIAHKSAEKCIYQSDIRVMKDDQSQRLLTIVITIIIIRIRIIV